MADNGRVRITLLGPLAVDGRPVRGDRLAAVVRELVAARGRAVSGGALAEAVWHGDPPEDASGAVQALVSRVRRLGVPVVAVPGGYRTPVEQIETDVATARTLAGQARAALSTGDATAARLTADQARACFPEVPEPAAEARLFGEIVALRAEAALAGAGALDDADLRLLAARTPPDEPATALLVRVLAAQGRDAEALDVIERLRTELADRYGTDPSPVIAEVHVALLRGDLAPRRDGLARKPQAPARRGLPGSWRRPGTALVGRDDDLAQVTAALADAPLVTIVATGGAGKTRLAAEVARRAEGAVVVVELAGVRTPAEVLPTILAALGGGETTSTVNLERRVLTPRERLRAAAPELDGLLVLDNCEHVLAAAADVVADLIDVAAEVAVLATSRAPLGLAGEIVHRLGTLPDAEALDLLDARARAGGAVPTWDADRALLLCRRLDNLPLALELAAARLRHMPIDDVLTGLDDRFALLDDALRGLPERHASLWAMVDWSRELLPGAERELLQRLAVIPARFTAEAAAAVAGRSDVRRGLAVLVEQSLLVLDQEDGEPRWRMLETVREYGEVRLGDRTAAMEGLLGWARTVAVSWLDDVIGPRQPSVLHAIARDSDNLQAALRWALAIDDEPAVVDVAATLFQFWMVRGLHVEVSQWARQVTHADDPAARLRSAVLQGKASGRPLPDADRLVWTGLMTVINGGITGPTRLVALGNRMVRTVMRERPETVSARRTVLAELLPFFGTVQFDRATLAAERMLGHEDAYVRGMGYFSRAAFRESGGMPAEAITDAEQAYAEFEAAGDHWGMAMAAQTVGNSILLRGTSGAVEWLALGVRHMELIGAAQDARALRVSLDSQLALIGDEEAEVRLQTAATSNPGEDWNLAQANLGLAHVAWQRGKWELVARYTEAVLRATEVFPVRSPQPRVLFQVAVAVTRLALATVREEPTADETARRLLVRSREEVLSTRDVPLIGAWAIGGATLALHRGDRVTARELWQLGMGVGTNVVALFPPGEVQRLTAALGEDRRVAERFEQLGPRIHELMDGLLKPSSGTP
ncbi:AAA family ATPase [Symbioplanes lichenis]|uniref:AAA family ATPase n=1 Tax=Symbioplanes lichenis TaxID=1629072 RepID=UPI0027384161|nr:AAA family ATPase [Actinoplanes lichenis]